MHSLRFIVSVLSPHTARYGSVPAGEDSGPLWRGYGFVTHVQRLPSSLRVTQESDLTAPGDGPSAEQLCRADVQKAVLPHVVPQLLPSVAPHMLPLLGFYIDSEHADTHVCHVYADVGDTLAGRFFCTPGRGVAERHCEAVRPAVCVHTSQGTVCMCCPGAMPPLPLIRLGGGVLCARSAQCVRSVHEADAG